MTPAHRQKFRSYALGLGVALTAIFGTWSGASLKVQRQAQKEAEKQLQVTPSEAIAMLEQRKNSLLAQQDKIERKIQEIGNRAAKPTRVDSMPKRDN
ncbi:unnamed protein product [Blumeria hordei]|uniref:Uncharacterized protein n=1 Tax=Blumeria hordei TaxID=2867405 RepID=A0A383UQQ6_BLUHO|nr:unnamed protein product [Blumeria hordei]